MPRVVSHPFIAALLHRVVVSSFASAAAQHRIFVPTKRLITTLLSIPRSRPNYKYPSVRKGLDGAVTTGTGIDNTSTTRSLHIMETKHMKGKSEKKTPALAKPSSSVLLISPTNQILLLRRVHTSSSFASAHVFPGGNVDEFHDGKIPDLNAAERHVDGPAYRLAAIRETFEESGILLAKDKKTGKLLSVDEAEREKGRHAVHAGKIAFPEWLSQQGGEPDTDNLTPFTRWITPNMVPKRFTTQMYLYFLPFAIPTNYKDSTNSIGTLPIESEATIPAPTHDGGQEHTAARFLSAAQWIKQAGKGEVILYPPQFFLLSIVAQFLQPQWDAYSTIEVERQRRELIQFLMGTHPSWMDACISPVIIGGALKDGRNLLKLDFSGDEVKGQDRQGIEDYVVIMGGVPGKPGKIEVRKRSEIADLLEEQKSSL